MDGRVRRMTYINEHNTRGRMRATQRAVLIIDINVSEPDKYVRLS